MSDNLSPFQEAVQRTSAAIFSGLRLVRLTYPSDERASDAIGWLETQSVYAIGLDSTVLPGEVEPPAPIERATDFETLAARVRACEQQLTETFPETWTREQLDYLTFVTEYASKLETYANRFA